MSPRGESIRPQRSMLAQLWRGRPVLILVSVVGFITLLFVGCLQLTEPTRLRQEPERLVMAPVQRLIRVRLGGRDPRDGATLEITSPSTVIATETGEVLATWDSRLRRCDVRPGPADGIDVRGHHFRNNDIFIKPRRDASIILNGQTYRGCLRIQREGQGLHFDNHLDVESYLRGVLRGELPRYFHPESFKAQAVAARTYVLYQVHRAAEARAFDVLDDERSQMYIGVRGEDRVVVRAVEATCGEVCVWGVGEQEAIFCTYYSSACGGSSQDVNNVKPRDPDVPPLAGGVVCNDCYLARFYRWDDVKLSKAEVTRRIVARYPTLAHLGTITHLRPKARTPDGRIVRMELLGSSGGVGTLVGEDFRLSIGGRTLKSTLFEVRTRGDDFIFEGGKGFGHGVGLCQHGMETKARRGMSYEQILATYYPGARLKRIY